jgi:signal transduction histidine kinase
LKKTEYNEKKGILIIVSDISEREKLVKLEEANSFRDNLINSVSHELRTPVNCVVNYINSAIEHYRVPIEVVNDILKPSLSCLSLLTSIIKDLLDYSLFLNKKF